MVTNERFEESISKWFEATAPARLPERALDAALERTRGSRQHVGWRSLLERLHLKLPVLVLGGVAVVVIAAAIALDLYADHRRVGEAPTSALLPSAPATWSRVSIATPSGTGTVASIAASQSRLLAVVGEQDGDGPTRLAVSTDGRGWTMVPDDQNPRPSAISLLGGPAIVGTDRGFVLASGNEIWSSEQGYEWQRIADPTTDPALDMKRINAVAVGGPGLVAVGGDTAWHSVDGSDWSRADVPPGSTAASGIAATGGRLVAWGITEVRIGDESVFGSELWASEDGRSWTDVLDPRMGVLTAVTGGPHGFVAAGGEAGGEPAIWYSADGAAWERVTTDAFGSRWQVAADDDAVVTITSGAATSAGYVLAGNDSRCLGGLCPRNGLEFADISREVSTEAVIWTSEDGRSWSRIASDDRFKATDPAGPSGAEAGQVVAWGSRFIVGGSVDDEAVIWISGPHGAITSARPSPDGAFTSATPSPTVAPSEDLPVTFAGTWDSTDGDGSHQTLEIIERPDGTYDLTYRDDGATVCGGAPLTMAGLAERVSRSAIVIERPAVGCDDGSTPQPVSGEAQLENQLRDFRFAHDSAQDALIDSFGIRWRRTEVTP